MIPDSKDETEKAVQLSLSRADMVGGGADAIEARRAIEYYRDVSYQDADLVTQYSKIYANLQKWKDKPKAVYNLTAGIVDAVSTLYSDPVVYEFEDERSAALWAEVRGWASLMADVDRYTMLGGTLGVRPYVDDSATGFYVYLADQIEYVQEPEDSLKAQQITVSWITGQGSARQKVAHHWTDAEYAETVDDTLVGQIEPNPYGVIPIVMFRNEEPRWDYFGEPARDLVTANLALNSMMTDLNHTVRWQSHGQLVLIGAPSGYKPPIGPDTYLAVSNAPSSTGADARYINPGADIGAIINAINQNLEMLFSARRIPKSAVVAVQGDSGISLVAQQAALRDYRKKRITAFRPLEEQLISLTLKVINYHQTGKVEEFEPPTIKYTELEAPMSDDARLDWDWRLRLGVSSPVDVMLALNPGMGEEEAREKITENLAMKSAAFGDQISAKRATMPPDEIEDEGQGLTKGTAPDANQTAAEAATKAEVQQTGLNGAQVTALQGIMTSVSDGSLSRESAKILIGLAFPLFSEADINRMVEASIVAEPKAEPTAQPIAEPIDDPEDADEDDQ